MSEQLERLTAALEGRYAIERKLGEGGMASVYLAKDVKHSRKVAVKVLRPELAAVIGAERFLAEITTTANLQHPHILPLFDSGDADGFLYYVMPFIDGETLGERLKREGQLGVDEAVRLTREIADALHHAHKAGVIHRDIKPGNILLQDGRPMVADFGIALAVSEAGGGRMTETGLSLGTPHYMSPEQASADRNPSARSDIYSLGCVLYEMLAGQPPHTGPSAQSILVRILTEPPRKLTELRHTVPPNVSAAVSKAIEKLSADRFESAADFAAALVDPAFRYEAVATGTAAGTTAGSATGAATTTSWFAHGASRAAVAGLVVLGVGLVAVGSMALRTPQVESLEPAVVSFELEGLLDSVNAANSQWAISDDGSAIAYAVDGGPITYMRLDGSVKRELSGTDDAYGLVFSPDGAWIAYRADTPAGGMYRIGIDGGTPLEFNVDVNFVVPGYWDTDGTLYYSTLSGMYRLAEGGSPELLLGEGFVAARWPHPLPGGDLVLYTSSAVGEEGAEIRALDVKSGESRTVVGDGFDAFYVEPGHLVYGRYDGSLVVVDFDPKSAAVGQAVSIMDSVLVEAQAGSLGFQLSRSGAALYARGGTRSQLQRQANHRLLAMVDQNGGLTLDPLAPGRLFGVAAAPNGRAVSYARDSNVYIYDLVTNEERRFSQQTGGQRPRWSRDGATLSYNQLGGGAGGQIETSAMGPADGSTPPTTLASQWGIMQVLDYTPGGDRLLVQAGDLTSAVSLDLYVTDLDGGNPVPYLRAEWRETRGVLTPDGKWAAYVSNQTGENQVFVRSFPDPGLATPVSAGAGDAPRWSPDGRTLYYSTRDSIFAASMTFDSGAIVASRRAILYRETEYGRIIDWDVYPQGGFVAIIEPPTPAAQPGDGEPAQAVPYRTYFVVNWVQEMLKRVGG
jgi:serine/threonine-protein kinase